MRILIVEVDALLGDGLRTGLKQIGFTADWVRDDLAARAALAAERFAAAVGSANFLDQVPAWLAGDYIQVPLR
jgi:DNA-binding response OmpR family regulator